MKEITPESSKEEVLATVRQYGGALKDAAPELRADKEVVLEAVKSNPDSFKFASDELRADKEFLIDAIVANPFMIMSFQELEEDRDVVLAAVEKKGYVMHMMSNQLKANKDFVLSAVEQNGNALQYASPELRADREVVLAAVQQHGWVLYYSSDELKVDKEVVLAAVKQDGLALQSASDELKGDRGVVLTAVQQDGRALVYVSAALRADREVVMAALNQDIFFSSIEDGFLMSKHNLLNSIVTAINKIDDTEIKYNKLRQFLGANISKALRENNEEYYGTSITPTAFIEPTEKKLEIIGEENIKFALGSENMQCSKNLIVYVASLTDNSPEWKELISSCKSLKEKFDIKQQQITEHAMQQGEEQKKNLTPPENQSAGDLSVAVAPQEGRDNTATFLGENEGGDMLLAGEAGVQPT